MSTQGNFELMQCQSEAGMLGPVGCHVDMKRHYGSKPMRVCCKGFLASVHQFVLFLASLSHAFSYLMQPYICTPPGCCAYDKP